MRTFEPCMCGDSECPRCGFLQGTLSIKPEVCERCHGKGFLNPDGTPNNAFDGSDFDPVIECSDCDGEGRYEH